MELGISKHLGTYSIGKVTTVVNKVDIEMLYKDYRDMLSYFKQHKELPLKFTKEGIVLDYMTAGSLSYQHCIVKKSLFKGYKVVKDFIAWVDVNKLAKRTSGLGTSVRIIVDDTKIYVSSIGIKSYSQKLLNKPDPTVKIEFDQRGVPDLSPIGIEAEYNIASEMKFPKISAIYSTSVHLHFELAPKSDKKAVNPIFMEMRDLDSDSRINIGKWESNEDVSGIKLELFADILKDNINLFESGKTVYIACGDDESAPIVGITRAKHIDNFLIMMPINSSTSHIPDSITEEDEIDSFSDDFDADLDEEE